MKQDEIDTLLNSFFLSEKDLASRELFKEFSASLSDIIIDDFAKNYLLNNPYLSVYLAHTDGSMLLKKIKDFFAFVLIEPVNEFYVKKVHFIGSVHYSIKLDPAKVSYGFWAISEIVNKMAEVNEVVREYRVVITKMLRLIEHLMNDGYYIERDKNISRNESHTINAQNELYIGFNLHKLNMQKISMAVSMQDISLIEEIESSSAVCIFGKIINELLTEKKYEYILGFNTQDIKKIHDNWHTQFLILKESIENKNKEKTVEEYNILKNLTQL